MSPLVIKIILFNGCARSGSKPPDQASVLPRKDSTVWLRVGITVGMYLILALVSPDYINSRSVHSGVKGTG